MISCIRRKWRSVQLDRFAKYVLMGRDPQIAANSVLSSKDRMMALCVKKYLEVTNPSLLISPALPAWKKIDAVAFATDVVLKLLSHLSTEEKLRIKERATLLSTHPDSYAKTSGVTILRKVYI